MNTTITQTTNNTAIIQPGNTTTVRYAGSQNFSVETSVFRTFPKILQLQIASPGLCHPELGAELRKQLAHRLISMLSVKFEPGADLFHPPKEDEFSPMALAIGEFCSFLKDCKLTLEELLEAYRMGIKKQLRDRNYNAIKIYPTLSVIQAGEVIDAYQRHKRMSTEYNKGLQKLKELMQMQNKPEQPQESPEDRQKKLIANLNLAISENRDFHGAFLLYDYVIAQGGLADFRNDKKAQKIMVNQKMAHIIQRERQNKKFSLFSPIELNILKNAILSANENTTTEHTSIQHRNIYLEKKLKNLAIIEVKNMLVYNWFKKNLITNPK